MSVTTRSVPVQVTRRGNVGSGTVPYARKKIQRALGLGREPMTHAHVVLEWRRDPAIERPALAEATVDVDGTIVRATSVAPTMVEAVDDLEGRLRRQLVQLEGRTRTRHRWTALASEHEWRHGDLPRRRAAHFPRPAESREVVRRKSFTSAPMTVDEAAYEMDLLDHDFFVYTDVDTGKPALVHRLDSGGYGIQGAAPQPGSTPRATIVQEPAPPILTDDEARARLDADDEPFVFYLDEATGEGRVIYLRYDGQYGIVTERAEPRP
ncbi:HPF/RaiA family ribosome-associated protein [Pedococcus bigeumensis]|uniref:ribosome hibernation promotion factor n=1 Tax=Pedococcus bigeumensis TaxID=433644 RepID=UPI002FEBCA1B